MGTPAADVFTKTELENATGPLLFSVPAGLSPESQDRLLDGLGGICREGAQRGLKLAPLRLISLPLQKNLGAVVEYWQDQFGEPVSGISKIGRVCGKTLTTADRTGSPLAVVVLDAEVALGAAAGNTRWKAIVFHELVHVHVAATAADNRPPCPRVRDIPALRRYVADMLWQEHLAERLASRYLAVSDFELYLDTTDILEAANERISGSRQRVVADQRWNEFWSANTTQLVDVGQQLARVLGTLADPRAQDHRRRFLEAVSLMPPWNRCVQALDGAFASLFVGDATPGYLEAVARLEPMVPILWEAHGIFVSDQGEVELR